MRRSPPISPRLRSSTITDAEAIGRFELISEADMFDCEYWSLEQAKLGSAKELPLAGQIAAITGAGGGIGAATAKAFAAAGAEVALLDVDADKAAAVAKATGGAAFAVACDVTDAASVDAAFAKVAERFGGVDIVVSNAGAAWQGRIGEVAEEVLRKSFELNFYGHQRVAQAAVRIMLAQGTGGCLLFNVSKQAVNPGPDFGPYGLPKAATLFLARQYAVDYGAQGIRANVVNADRVRSGLLTADMIATRSAARGVSEKDYMSGNLLGREVTADDVAQAFVAQALALKTTAGIDDRRRRQHRRRPALTEGAALHTPIPMPVSCPPVEALVARFRERTATVGIIGLGYVGLPLVQALLDNGFAVIGFDIDPAKVEALEAGRSYIHHIPGETLRAPVAAGRFLPTTDFAEARARRRDPHLRADAAHRASRARPLLCREHRAGDRAASAARASSSCWNRRPIPAPRARW